MKRLFKLTAIIMIAGAMLLSACDDVGDDDGDSSSPLSSDKAITAFSIVNPAATGTINEEGHSIMVSAPSGTDPAALIAEYTTTGVLVEVYGTEQQNGVSENDFSSPVTYTVTAEDNSTQDYTVIVTVEDKTYAIGDTGPSGVGIVFYITDGGLHGLEVAPSDQASYVSWSNVTDTSVGTTGTAIGTGNTNTTAIIAQSGHTSSAALICRNYRADEEGDWFLPSRGELHALYDSGFFNYSGGYYWSSSERNAENAYSPYPGIPQMLWYNYKYLNGSSRVRAIRAF